jgi:hypothetical protein
MLKLTTLPDPYLENLSIGFSSANSCILKSEERSGHHIRLWAIRVQSSQIDGATGASSFENWAVRFLCQYFHVFHAAAKP